MEQATGEVDIIFEVSNGLRNDSATPSAPCTLGIPVGTGVMVTQQDTEFLAEGHAPTAGTVQNLHRALMGGIPMLQNTGVGGNGMGEEKSPAAVPPAATAEG